MIEGADVSQLVVLVGAMMAAGLLAGFAAGLFGIGGGFVVVPALVAVFEFTGASGDVLMHLAVGTSLATIIITSMRSVRAHAERGAVDFTVLKTWAPWIVVGVILGAIAARYVESRQLMLFFAIGVLIMGIWMLLGKKATEKPGATMPRGALRAGLATFMGWFASLMGIGGGTFAVVCLTLSGKSIHQAVATAAGFGAIIALPGTIMWILIGLDHSGLPFGSIGYVNLIALASVSAMTLITAPLGASLAHKLDPMMLKRVFAIYLLFTSATLMGKGLELDMTGLLSSGEDGELIAVIQE